MSSSFGDTTRIDGLLRLLQSGDPSARAELIERANERLRLLAHHMLHRFPSVERWEQTDDIFNQALTRLHQSLADVQPESTRHFYNLAAMQIRRVLIDLARKYSGPSGQGANHESQMASSSGMLAQDERFVDPHEPTDVLQWAEFHEHVERLPEAEREVFSLLWYEGLSQEEASELLDTSVRTVKRRWQTARFLLFKALDGQVLKP